VVEARFFRGERKNLIYQEASPHSISTIPGANGGRIKVQFIFMNTFESVFTRSLVQSTRKLEFTLLGIRRTHRALLIAPSSSTSSTAACNMTKTVRSLAFTFVNHLGSSSRDLTSPVCVFAMVIMDGEKNGKPEG